MSTQIPRSMTATTLTAQQLQQLTSSRGQVLPAALQNALRGASPRQALTRSPSTPVGAQAQTMLRGSTVHTVGPRMTQPTIALQRATSAGPGVIPTSTTMSQSPIAVAVGQPRIALSTPGTSVRTGIVTATGSPRVIGQTTPLRGNPQRPQQIVVASPGHHPVGSGQPRQIVMTPGRKQVRGGQIVQLTGQAAQQIVVSQGGQLILNPTKTSTN